ncbi:hypothetical protein SDC9_195003 [bioreactor metagenome]|uniref:Uncharacterized protein n=1 Tax=bioreactor metagenome TaxID=1076179 RepID=A0A645I7V0_9ZZZZ
MCNCFKQAIILSKGFTKKPAMSAAEGVSIMANTSNQPRNRLRDKLFSPLYLAVTLVVVIVVGNFFNWADAVYGTHLNSFSPVLVLLTIVLFIMYIYRVFRSA